MKRETFLLPAAIMTLAACSNYGGEAPEPTPPPPASQPIILPPPPAPPAAEPVSARCNPAAGQYALGREISETLGAELLRATTSRRMRWIGPDMAVTKDYRRDRLNAEYDKNRRITHIYCG